MVRNHSQEPFRLKSLSVMRNENDINNQSGGFSRLDGKEYRKAMNNTFLEAEDLDRYAFN